MSAKWTKGDIGPFQRSAFYDDLVRDVAHLLQRKLNRKSAVYLNDVAGEIANWLAEKPLMAQGLTYLMLNIRQPRLGQHLWYQRAKSNTGVRSELYVCIVENLVTFLDSNLNLISTGNYSELASLIMDQVANTYKFVPNLTAQRMVRE